MALTPDTDQFSQFLRLAFLRSPNYAAGVSGWTINQDGSVEFNNGTFRGSIVGGALFIYSGAPGLGNPPQLAIVPGTTTQDPYGNAVTSSKILMQNNVITMSAGIFRTAAAAPLIQLDGNHNAVLIYDSGSHLRETMAPAATTDGLGNTVYAGIVDYSTAVNAIAQLLNGFLNVGTPAQIAGTGGAAAGQVGLASAGNPGVVRVDSGLTATGDADAFMDVRSKNAQSSINAIAQRNIQLAGPLALSSEGSTPAQLVTAEMYDGGDGFGKMQPGSVASGDTNVYGLGVVKRALASAFGVGTLMGTITDGTTSFSATVAAKRYYLRGRLSCTMGSNPGQILLQVAGPAITSMEVGYWKSQNNPGGATLFSATQLAISTATNPFTVNEGALNGFTIFFEGTILFSASGTISLQAQRQNAANPVQINTSSFMKLEPI